MKKILLGISASIAAYKTPQLVRELIAIGFEVRVVLTKNTKQFVSELTLQTLSQHSVHDAEFVNMNAETNMSHIELAKWADIILIAPASANIIAKLAIGMADDLLSTLCLASTAKIYLAPAMNQQMWANKQVQQNIAKLKNNNFFILEPEAGEQACGDVGVGRMMEVSNIVAYLKQTLYQPLKNINVLITAGATREPIDPVRFLSNHSSGKMGYALADEAARLGANVSLISAHASAKLEQQNVIVIKVNTADEMLNAVKERILQQNIFIACAAVCDYKVKNIAKQKIKKSSNVANIELIPNVDVLASISSEYSHLLKVGFAAETENLIINAQQKLINKKLDMIIANDVSDSAIGFNSENNQATLITKSEQFELGIASKSEIAKLIFEFINTNFLAML